MHSVKITWSDHFSETGWKDIEEVQAWVESNSAKPCVTVGFLAYEDDKILVVAGSHDGCDSYGDFMAIYKNHIIRRERLDII